MPPRWSSEMSIKFVKLYRKHECLWDQFHQLYKNKTARESALLDIAVGMHIEGLGTSDVNRKIKALRATYHSEMTKVVSSKESGCDEHSVYTPTLAWIEDMKHIMTAGTGKRKNKSTEVPNKPMKRQLDSKEEEGTTSENDERDEEQYFQSEHLPTKPQPKNISTKDTTTPKRFKHRSITQQTAATASEPNHLDQSVTTPLVLENEFDIFGKHVASQLKQLKVHHAVTAIGDINNILMQKRLASLFGHTDPNNCGPTSSFTSSQDLLSPIININTIVEAEEVITEHSLDQV